MSKILSIEEILALPDLEEKEVYVDDWKGIVKVRGLTKAAQQRLRQQATVNGETDPDKLEILLLAECMAEPKITIEQAEQLKEKSAAAIDCILREIVGLARLTEEAQKQALKSFRAGDA